MTQHAKDNRTSQLAVSRPRNEHCCPGLYARFHVGSTRAEEILTNSSTNKPFQIAVAGLMTQFTIVSKPTKSQNFK